MMCLLFLSCLWISLGGYFVFHDTVKRIATLDQITVLHNKYLLLRYLFIYLLVATCLDCGGKYCVDVSFNAFPVVGLFLSKNNSNNGLDYCFSEKSQS